MARLVPPPPYRWLYAATPRSFRRRHGEEIATQLNASAPAPSTPWAARCRFWTSATLELARSLPALWIAEVRRTEGALRNPRDKEPLMSSLWQDIRYGWRGLIGNPGASILCVLAIALGIGANTTVFTLANEIFLKPIPVEQPTRLVNLHVDQPGANSFVGFSYPEYEDLVAATELEAIGVHSGLQFRFGDDGAVPVRGQASSASYLRALGVDVAQGRVFDGTEDQPGGPLVAVVSHGFWQRRLGGTPEVIGAPIELDGNAFTVIGVLGEGFNGRFIGFPSEVWVPLGALELLRPGMILADRSNQFLEAIGRLSDGASIDSAQGALNVVAAQLEERYPETHGDRRVRLSGFTGLDDSLRAGVIGFVGVLMLLSALVLAAACLNVGNVLLARAQARASELATRMALGAGRSRMVRQLLTETLLLFAFGATAAALLTLQLRGLLLSLVAGQLPLGLALSIDLRVLAGTGAITLATALATGLQPAWRATSPDRLRILTAGRGTAGSGRRLRGALVAAQVAVSVVLLVTAGLFLRALAEGRAQDPGFPTENLHLGSVSLDSRTRSMTDAGLFFEQLSQRLSAAPGVDAVGMGSSTPVGVANTPMPVNVPGLAPPEGQDAFFVDAHVVDSGYFTATGIRPVRGRALAPTDVQGNVDVGVVNETLARQLWPDRSAVGEQLLLNDRAVQIVGVVSDTLHLVQNRTAGPLLYLPYAQQPRHAMTFVFRSAATPAELSQLLSDRVDQLDAEARVTDVRAQQDILDAFLVAQSVASRVASALGLVAVILALTGVYGMVAFAAASRGPEMGIRMALGAEPRSTTRLVLRAAVVLVAAGGAVGLLVSAALGPLLQSFLFGVSPLDPLTLATVLGGIVLAGAAAAYMPARRVSSIDPAAALRGD